MRNDERLRTIYEVMAPYIVRNEHNWRDYLAFASQFHKHSFDNILLVYAQDEDVSILATRKQWAAIGRNLIPRAKGVAVCVYRNAKLTLDYLFDVSQTTGKEIHPTDWQLSDEMKKALTERLSYAHGFPKQDFPQALYAMASESVAENYNHFLQELKQETKGHLFTEIPAGGFEAQYIQLLTDSISYFIGKKCHLPDEEIQLSDGMATVSHFNTLPLVAHLGTAVTALSKGILLEVERNIKIINRERMAQHEQTEYQSEIQGAGRDDASRSANLQQQRSRSTSGQVRPDGPGIPQRESPGAIYDFENGWQSDGDHAPGTGRGDREDRSPDAANAPAGAASADRGHHGADATPEQSETDGGGNRTPERSPDSPLTEEQPNTEVAPSAASVGEPSEKDGSFSVPAEQPTRHFTDAEVRRNYEYILTSTNLYPPELHSAVRSVLSEPPLNPDWSDKGRQIAALFTPYGDREYQGDLLYRTRLHGEDGISFFFNEGYTYIPWNGLAFLLDAMIEDGDYPNPVVEEQPDPIGDYNIPDEVDEMGGPHRQMTIGEADFDYVLDAVAYPMITMWPTTPVIMRPAMNPQRNRRLRIPMANKQKQMLAVWGSPGGGKTVTAVKLALELSKRKKNVVLVFTDVTAPTLPAVVSEKKLPDVSVGELLAAPGMTQEQVLKTCVPCEKNPYISFLGYKAGENVFTHAEYSKEKAVDMLVLLRHIADYVIVDCTSLLTGNVLATTALEVADDVLRVCSCDLKAIS